MTEKVTLRTVPLSIKLNEDGDVNAVPTRIQVIKTGKFFDKRYGEITVTKEMLDNMVKKFDEGVRGIELMIDYSHKSNEEAAGWIKSLDVVEVQLDEENNKEWQLWANVDWTPEGQVNLAEKKFRYVSADFETDYRDNENPDVSHGPVLLGAGLTNRPVIKRMQAIQLSELEEKPKEGEMPQLTEAEATQLQTDNADMKAKLEKLNSFMSDMGVDSMEALMKMISDLRSSNESMLQEKAMADKDKQLSELMEKGLITAAQKESAMKLSEEGFKAVVEVAKLSKPVVKLDETGENQTPKNDEPKGEDVQDKVFKLAEEKMANDKGMSMTNAIALTLSENPKLKEQYYGEE